ncbi:putative cenp-s complex centromere protein x protein [Neofusicoccum parvum UCRNP2]|uniref:CENP-s complex centromere protein x protein n=2 Tax=Neofusicoccum parvum TaxID=310453 RepID=A0ACB5RX49_9PEZI|nr:putative cenp-s complex centromere protein x protein [Neofusicoccum parvum UCRNP2]GME25071.1 CENP-s complex centromere protein x protein [Neofusicoccum parvum]
MPPVRTTSKNTAFKPPRRISDKSNTSEPGASKATAPRPAAASTSKASAPASSRAAAFKPATTLISSDSDLDDIDDDTLDDDVAETAHRRRSANAATGHDVSTTDAGALPDPIESDDQPPIPTKLLNRLLHEGFEDEDMRIGKEAMAVASKYVETFVREALARAIYEREEADRKEGGAGDGFLQVEDLEKLAPQLLLDF